VLLSACTDNDFAVNAEETHGSGSYRGMMANERIAVEVK
jgi:hypothetical protein